MGSFIECRLKYGEFSLIFGPHKCIGPSEGHFKPNAYKFRVIIGSYFLLQSSNKIVTYKKDCTMPNVYSQDNASMDDDDAISYVSAESDFDDDDDAMSHKSTSTLANIRSDIKVCL